MENREQLIAEWKEIFYNRDNFYIYGAAVGAKKCLQGAEKTGVSLKIKGCVVTNANENPVLLCGLKVEDIHCITDKDINILVTHVGFYKEEINELLKTLGFKNVFFVAKYMDSITERMPIIVDDKEMQSVKKYIIDLAEKKTREDIAKDEEIKDYITILRQKAQPDFGTNHFYQSCERIGLEGVRPTTYRIKKYRLLDFLNKKQNVLDIGCNTGFFDIEISSYVNQIIGIEYDKDLVEIANYVKNQLEVRNIFFFSEDFCKWSKENNMKFDVIFSFAIHHWLDLDAIQYIEILDELLKQNGYLCFESHDMNMGDEKYPICINALLKKGYVICWDGEIIDDGLNLRKYAILRKSE